MTWKVKHKILYIMLCLLITQGLGFGTVPSEAGTKTGRIEIDYRGRDSLNQELCLTGARFTLYPVQKKVSGVLCWQGGFAAADVSLADTSAGARKQQAQDLFTYAQLVNASGVTQVTDAMGCTVFADLDEGIYLLAQIGYVEIGTHRFQSPPFLVEIPSNIDGTASYDVIVEPKAEWVLTPTQPDGPQPTSPEKPGPSGSGGSHTGPGPAETTASETKPSMPPTEGAGPDVPETEPQRAFGPLRSHRAKTGDASNMGIYLIGMVVSLISLLMYGGFLHKKK